jgi:hypothetical protein
VCNGRNTASSGSILTLFVLIFISVKQIICRCNKSQTIHIRSKIVFFQHTYNFLFRHHTVGIPPLPAPSLPFPHIICKDTVFRSFFPSLFPSLLPFSSLSSFTLFLFAICLCCLDSGSMKQNPFVRPGADWMLSKKGNRPVKKKEPKQYIDTNAPWVTPPWWKNIAVTDVSVDSL